MTVITVSICSSRLTTGSDRPPAVRPFAAESLLSTWRGRRSTATMPMTVTATFAALSRARRGLRPIEPDREECRDRQPPRDPDERAPAPRRPPDVVQRVNSAGARGPDRGDERRGERDRDCQADYLQYRDRGERGCARATGQCRAGIGKDRRDQPSGNEPDSAANSASARFSVRNTAADEARACADGLEHADSERVFRQPPSDQDGHAGDSEEREEKRAGLEHRLRVLDQQRVGRRDSLPGRELRAGERRGDICREPLWGASGGVAEAPTWLAEECCRRRPGHRRGWRASG